MHTTQQKILQLLETGPLNGLTLREIGAKVGEPNSPQKVKHHLDQLAAKGFIRVDKQANAIERIESGGATGRMISLPIMGSANCGEATFFADNQIEGYLQVSKTILGDLYKRVKDLFVLRVVGNSMNRADVASDSIEDGDYVIVDKNQNTPREGGYVVSVISGVANIKKMYLDHKKSQVVLVSESSHDIPPIYIHTSDLDSYVIAGTVVKVMKQPDEFADLRQAAANDVLKDLGTMSDQESAYYNNPANFK